MTELDLVLYGATGYTGRMVAQHLARQAAADVRIALAGRSRERVAALRAELGTSWDIREVDAVDAAALAGEARVVCTTVGPYVRHGWPLVAACAQAGTHYVDLVGEVLFHRRVADELDAPARASGARLVLSCGFDSVPSDLLVHTLAEQVRTDGQGDLLDVDVVATVSGGVSGGTLDSLRGQLDAAAKDPAVAALLADPYALSPDRAAEPAGAQPPDLAPVGRTADGGWAGPFVMASYNSRVVRRSNALLGWAYGRDLRYGERMAAGSGPLGAVAAAGTAASLRAVGPVLRFAPTRALLDRVLPAPGEGPGPKAQARGRYRLEATARTSTGATYTAVVAAAQEPYAATAVMMAEGALALLGDDLPERAGALTPATALGSALADRLRAQGTELWARRTA